MTARGGRPVVAVLHPGRMGAAVAEHVRGNGCDVLYLPEGRSAASRERARRAGLTPAPSMSWLCARAAVIISICPPAAAEDVAALVGEHGFEGVYVDANAISPTRLPRIAASLPRARCVLDAAIFGPPPGTGRRTTVYLTGEAGSADLVADCLCGPDVLVERLAQPPPAASALKVAHSSYQKACRALAAVAHALADTYDVTAELVREAERSASSPLAEPGYLPSVAARAWRWAPELRDVALTLAEASLPAQQALAAAGILQRWDGDKDSPPTLERVLAQLRSPSPTLPGGAHDPRTDPPHDR